MFHCPVGIWVIEQRAIMSSATVRSPTVIFIIFLSSTQCIPLGCPFPTKLKNVALVSVFKTLAYKYVISFELRTRMDLGLKGPFRSFV